MKFLTKKMILFSLPLLALLLGGIIFWSCGSSNSDISTAHNATYIGVGSYWNWEMKADNTFTATHSATRTSAALMTINGTYETLTTGFYRFTVTSATGDDAPSAGEQAYGFGVPGVIMAVKPIGDDSEIMIMPSIGSCPTAALEFNWVQAETTDESGDLRTEGIWGNATLPLTGNITGHQFILDGTVSAEQTLTAITSCADGIISLDNGSGETGFITVTTAGVGIVTPDETASGDSIIALPRDTSVSAATLAGKEFIGLLFSEDDDDDESDTEPMKVIFSADGTSGTYSFITDVTTGTTGESGPLAIEVGSGEKAGFVKIVANSATDPEQPTLWAAVVPDINSTGRTFLFASGVSVPTAGGDADHSFSLVMIEK